MNVVMQGMRRSGTTIAFDAFWEDGRFDCFYEPLAAARAAPGGGSRAHEDDLFAPVRVARGALLESWPDLAPELLNHGAPRSPAIEVERDVPAYIRTYLASLLDRQRPVVAKFTRMASKIPVLHELDPDAVFVHLVRDPRAVTASHLFGRGEMHRRRRYPNEVLFFHRRSRASTWSSRPLARAVRSTGGYPRVGPLQPDFSRILLLWAHHVRMTHGDASRLYGDRYLVVRHEDLAANPVEVLGGVYAMAGFTMPAHVESWLRENVRPPSPPYAADHPAWRRWARKIGMEAELEVAGYTL